MSHSRNTARRNWFDPEQVKRRGAIVVATPDHAQAQKYRPWFEGRTLTTLRLPYHRTMKTDQHAYVYYLIPPLDCPGRQ